MKTIVVLGAGKIGRMVAHFLGNCGDYRLRIGDADPKVSKHVVDHVQEGEAFTVDFSSAKDLDRILAGADAVVSCAPYHCNPL
ncbi:MAG: saccharopine dehydrogenase NADP-binding domain-containing protein, partial [Planctomycetota bacterium]